MEPSVGELKVQVKELQRQLRTQAADAEAAKNRLEAQSNQRATRIRQLTDSLRICKEEGASRLGALNDMHRELEKWKRALETSKQKVVDAIKIRGENQTTIEVLTDQNRGFQARNTDLDADVNMYRSRAGEMKHAKDAAEVEAGRLRQILEREHQENTILQKAKEIAVAEMQQHQRKAEALSRENAELTLELGQYRRAAEKAARLAAHIQKTLDIGGRLGDIINAPMETSESTVKREGLPRNISEFQSNPVLFCSRTGCEQEATGVSPIDDHPYCSKECQSIATAGGGV